MKKMSEYIHIQYVYIQYIHIYEQDMSIINKEKSCFESKMCFELFYTFIVYFKNERKGTN